MTLKKFHTHIYQVSGMMQMDQFAETQEEADQKALQYFLQHNWNFQRSDKNFVTIPASFHYQPLKFYIGTQPLIHRTKYCKQWFPKLDLKNKFKKPSNLTIVTCHNYSEKSIFEQSLEFLGINEYENVIEPFIGPWRYAYKIKFLLNFLDKCKTPYLLFCDARDCILRDDPQLVLDIFLTKRCELLFCSTMHLGGYACMPEIYQWTRNIQMGRYLNSGVFIGEVNFIKQVLEDAVQYVTDQSMTYEDAVKTGTGKIGKLGDIHNTLLCEALPEFPKNALDQEIFRFLHPKYYPRMAIDYFNELVWRN